MAVHKILLIATGGTIAGEVAKDKRDEQDIRKAQDFSELIRPTHGYLKQKWNVEVEVTPFEFVPVDSSDILPENWKAIVAKIKSEYDNYDSFVITHGTNTMGYTSAALSFAVANSDKPIVITGSQVPSGMPGTDALTNLNNAIRVATWPYQPIKGVVAVFGSHIITGTRVKKNTEFDYDAFKSFTTGSIGRIGRIINMNSHNLESHNAFSKTDRYNPALTADDLIVENDFNVKSIASLTEFPGMSKQLLIDLVDKQNIKGIVFRAFGAGDVSHHLHCAFEYLKEKEIPVIVTTQAPNGNSNFQVNEPGQHLAEKNLAIPAYDMSIEAMTTKLGWLLSQKDKNKINYVNICDLMTVNIRGEINVLKELRQ